MKKIINVIIIAIVVITSIGINSNVYATKHTAGEVIGEADSFISTGEGKANGIITEEKMKELSNTIYNILLVIAIVVAVLIGAVLGLKFIMEGVEGKAEVQKALVPYVVGCIVSFGAFTIWKVVVIVLQGLE